MGTRHLRWPAHATLLCGILCLLPAAANGQTSRRALGCDLATYRASEALRAEVVGELLTVQWEGAEGQDLRMRLTIEDDTPVLSELALRQVGGEWMVAAREVGFEFKIVEGLRRISNQQLAPLRGLGVELTQEVVDRYKWDVFWDAPLDLRTEVSGGNPPPAEGVARQPGLPRSTSEIRRSELNFESTDCLIVSDGARLTVAFSGAQLGSFEGQFDLTVYEGTNLVRAEVVAATSLPSVAYKYDVGLTGLELSSEANVSWRDIAGEHQSYALRGPPNRDHVVLRTANRLVVAETAGAAIAAFPPPHTFFWAREIEVVVGNNWYRKDDESSFSFGIRQGEQEVVERYLANWSLYSAPPGSQQRMAGYFYPILGEAPAAFEAALAFTNGDVYQPLPGYQVMGSHYHTNFGRRLMESGSVDTRLSDFEVLRSAGINIAGPVDRPNDATQLEEQYHLFEGAERHSDEDFMVLPEMENSNLLGGHWDLLFSHPVYYVDERAEGTPLVTEHPDYGSVYHIGNVEDMITMIEAEDLLVYMPHPRTKGSTGYPDAISDTPQFLNDRYRGVGWRWGMGSDLSEIRLSDFRVIPLLDDMNNWIADTDLQPKSLLAITETYAKAPGDDVYGNGPVSYLRLEELPEPGNYAPILSALMNGEYFISSGEVLISSHSYSGSGESMVLNAEVRWTFPLDFVEVVYGDGETTTTRKISATDLLPFGQTAFRIPFDATGQRWVRFAAWDSAGNGAMTMPVRIGGDP